MFAVAKRSLFSKESPRHRIHDRAAGGCDLNLTTSALSAVDMYYVQVAQSPTNLTPDAAPFFSLLFNLLFTDIFIVDVRAL
ncbi:hypothetical protein Y032_0004g2132 [Ancylostoma ceylanicum]|uniref:Uncharacterized protein n=1 Tax=Ancylostoma ceylanicum TaxID=53326 RepID=A0A016VUW8_9BILA|nr:hypothetical protein Y032_0004g2132 [Ancylostoma ceylanicum]